MQLEVRLLIRTSHEGPRTGRIKITCAYATIDLRDLSQQDFMQPFVARSSYRPASPSPSPRSPPTPPPAPSEGEDWLWASGHESHASQPSRRRDLVVKGWDENHSCRAHGVPSATLELNTGFTKPQDLEEQTDRSQPSHRSQSQQTAQTAEVSEEFRLPAPATPSTPSKPPFRTGAATPRASRINARRNSAAKSSRPPSAPSFARPFSLEGDGFLLSGRSVGYAASNGEVHTESLRPRPAASLSRGGAQRPRSASDASNASKPGMSLIDGALSEPQAETGPGAGDAQRLRSLY